MRAAGEYPNEWARLIAEIIARPGWSQKRLAETAHVHRHTIRRWKSGESANVSADSVRLIATAAGIDPDLAARAALGAQEQAVAEDDRAVQMILDSDASQDAKSDLIAHIRGRRREAQEAEIRDVEFWLRNHQPQPES